MKSFLVTMWRRKIGKLKAYAKQRVAEGAHPPTPRFFEPAKSTDDRADYCLKEKKKIIATKQ